MTGKTTSVSIADLKNRKREMSAQSIDARLMDEKKGQTTTDARRLRRGTSATVQLNVRLPETAKADVYQMAEELNMTIAEVIEQAIGMLKASQTKR